MGLRGETMAFFKVEGFLIHLALIFALEKYTRLALISVP